jgi:NitT/TauT family transport system ATP-binding protein
LLGDRIVVLSGTPGRVCLELDVPIPRPRTPQELRFHPAYPQVRRQLWEALQDGRTPLQVSAHGTVRLEESQ